MTKANQIAAIRAVVITDVPAIMELKFGCWVKWKDGGECKISNVEYGGYLSTINGGSLTMNHQNKMADILGRLSMANSQFLT